MADHIEFISQLIYGTDAEAVVTPNHSTFIAGPIPGGVAWLDRYVRGPTSLLAVYENRLRAESLPPIYPWNGVDLTQWDPEDIANAGRGIPLPADLQPTSLSFPDEESLGVALRDRLIDLQTGSSSQRAADLQDSVKAPYSHRFWGYLKWASLVLRRYHGELVNFDPPLLYDRDGTILTAIPFLNFVNDGHWHWHDFSGNHALAWDESSPAGQVTPGYSSPVGQRAHAIATTPGGQNEEFLLFHRDHVRMYNNWLARTGQSPVRAINMLSVFEGWGDPDNRGWPPDGAGNPSTWVFTDNAPWVNGEDDSDTGGPRLFDFSTRAELAGTAMGTYHAQGHNSNFDIRHPFQNNFVPRFFAWHTWLDDQWFFREPRFARFDAATGQRERVFRPQLVTSGDPWPGMTALTIVRDPAAAADTVSPAGAVGGISLGSGEGTLRMEFVVADTYGRLLRMELTAEVFDASNAVIPGQTVTLSRTVGPGGDFALDTNFTLDLAFSEAFRSNDPSRAAAAVGFVNSRIRVTATLAADDGSDPDFVHADHVDIDLVHETAAPDIDIFLNLGAFSQDQVESKPAEPDASKRFPGAVMVTVQDRTTRPFPIVWPPEIIEELEGVLSPPVPASGLFDDPAKAPTPRILPSGADTPIAGLEVIRSSGPIKEDPSLPDNVPQRFTYLYDVVFRPGHEAFAGLTDGDSQFGRLQVSVADRSGNAATEEVPVKFFRDANPYMLDGDPAWLSDDTRVLRVFEGETVFGVTLVAGQPESFIAAVLDRFNDPSIDASTRDGWLSDLPTFSGQDVLEFSTSITTPATGDTRQVYNFALARVRLRGSDGATRVRGFFRLFTHSASNLVFDDGSTAPDRGGYRTHVDGARRVPLLGFADTGEVISIPFFAVPRVGFSEDTRSQPEDTPNVRDFSGGSTDEQIRYFGAYLDINQDAARLPPGRVSDSARIDGGFTSGEVQPIRTLIRDAHQCMVVEVMYDGDETQIDATPFTSDNLAQRNLSILTSDNPGSAITRTVQHSFEAQIGGPRSPRTKDLPEARRASAPLQLLTNRRQIHRAQLQHTGLEAFPAHGHGAGASPPTAATSAGAGPLTHVPAPGTAPTGGTPRALPFDAVRWFPVGRVVDELCFLWNGLPEESEVELFLPGVRAEEVLNLRKLRHAPDEVRIIDEHRLRITPRGSSFIPLPPNAAERVNGVITVTLPDGVRAGQTWKIDAVQLRGGERRAMGAFQLEIRVQKNLAEMARAELRLLQVLAERRSLLSPRDRWYPILARRVETTRARARALFDRAGLEWRDPTTWTSSDDPTGTERELEGPRLRVVVERIEILDDSDPCIKGRGEVAFHARVETRDNGGRSCTTRLPESGVYEVSDEPGRNMLNIERTIYAGHAAHDLRIQVSGTEKDTFDPDDWIGKFYRGFEGAADQWFGDYGPIDGRLCAEDVGPWRIWYRIERGAG